MGRTRQDRDTIEKALFLVNKKGYSARKAAREVEVHHATVARWLKEPAKFLSAAPSAATQFTTPKAAPPAASNFEAPPAAPPEAPGISPNPANDGAALELEYTPPPYLSTKHEEPTRCGECKTDLDEAERPRWCPGCGYRLLWSDDNA